MMLPNHRMLRQNHRKSLSILRQDLVILLPQKIVGRMMEACQQYGLVGSIGNPRVVEFIRCMMVNALMLEADDDTKAALAVKSNAKMILAGLGARMAKIWEYGVVRDTTSVKVRRDGSVAIHLHLDKFIRDQCEHYSKYYRTNDGHVQDIILYRALIAKGMSLPNLHTFMSAYQRLISPVRKDIFKFEIAVLESVKGLKMRLTKTLPNRAA